VFDTLIDDLETRRASLHQQIDAMVEKKSSLLNNQFHSGETLKHTMEELRDRCNDWESITNDAQCMAKLLESKKELSNVNQLFFFNQESFSNLIPSGRSAPYLAGVFFSFFFSTPGD
jgi:chromosome segregation ATPase